MLLTGTPQRISTVGGTSSGFIKSNSKGLQVEAWKYLRSSAKEAGKINLPNYPKIIRSTDTVEKMHEEYSPMRFISVRKVRDREKHQVKKLNKILREFFIIGEDSPFVWKSQLNAYQSQFGGILTCNKRPAPYSKKICKGCPFWENSLEKTK